MGCCERGSPRSWVPLSGQPKEDSPAATLSTLVAVAIRSADSIGQPSPLATTGRGLATPCQSPVATGASTGSPGRTPLVTVGRTLDQREPEFEVSSSESAGSDRDPSRALLDPSGLSERPVACSPTLASAPGQPHRGARRLLTHDGFPFRPAHTTESLVPLSHHPTPGPSRDAGSAGQADLGSPPGRLGPRRVTALARRLCSHPGLNC